MGSVKYFTSIDLRSGYWQCHIADDKDILKTTFLTRYDLYQWVIMLMGLKNAPATFMWTMNNLFSNMLDSGVAVFLDDILIYSCMVKKHFMLLKKVLVCLCQYTFYCISLRSVASYTTVQCSSVLILHLKVCASVTEGMKFEWMACTYYSKINTVFLRILYNILINSYAILVPLQNHCISWHARISYMHRLTYAN